LRNALVRLRQPEEFVGLRQRCRQRLFDEHIDPGFHQLASNGQMMNCRDCHRRALHFTVSGDELIERPERPATEFPAHGVGAGNVLVDHTQQAERLALLLQLFVDAGMVAAERAHTDDGDIDDAVGVQGRFSGGRLPPIADCNHEARVRISGFFLRTLTYKQVFLRIAICPAW
jgi:hypothetical protein